MNEIITTLESLQAIQEMGEPETFEHGFRAVNFGFSKNLSTIRVHIFKHGEQRLVVFEDLAKGTSVTNASEQLATEVSRLKKLDPEKTVFVECYPYYRGEYPIDRVKYEYDPGSRTYRSPAWEPIKNKIIVEFLRKHLSK